MENSNEPINQNQPAKINWRQLGKHWVIVFILAIFAGLVIWGLLNLGPWLKEWQDRRAAQSIISEFEKQYRNDKYGGQTPEETFEMFITALEKEDIALASKYFILEKQNQWAKTLKGYENKALLLNVIDELKNIKNAWEKIQTNDPSLAKFDYLVKDGKYTNSILFQKYPSGI